MNSPIIETATQIGFVLLSVAFLISLIRAIKGPRAADRVVALDLVAGICLTLLALLAIHSDQSVFLNVAVCISLLAFLSTAAFARYLTKKAEQK